MKPFALSDRSVALKRSRPQQPFSERPQIADRALITHGYRHPVTNNKFLGATMPLARTFDQFDETGVLDLSAWTEAQLATAPTVFYRAFPAEGGLTIRIDANIRQLPAALLKRPIAKLDFVNGPRGGQPAWIDLCRIQGPEGGRPEIDVSALVNATCVAPREWHDAISTEGHCRLMDPSDVEFHGLYMTPIVHPALGDRDEDLLSRYNHYTCAQVARHLSNSKQLDIIRKASILLRLHVGKQVTDAAPGWIAQGLRQLASNTENPPTAVELRFICQTLSHLAETAGRAENSPWELLVDALQLAWTAPFPEGGYGRGHWCQTMLRRIASKQGLSERITEQLFPLVRDIEAAAEDGTWLKEDCETTRKHLRRTAKQSIETEVEAVEALEEFDCDSATLTQLQHFITRDPGCRERLQRFMRNELIQQINANVALTQQDKEKLVGRLTT